MILDLKSMGPGLFNTVSDASLQGLDNFVAHETYISTFFFFLDFANLMVDIFDEEFFGMSSC